MSGRAGRDLMDQHHLGIDNFDMGAEGEALSMMIPS